MHSLTEQQLAFVVAFTSDPGAIGNASEAARRAGYSERSAREIGRQLLDKPHVQAAIAEANRSQISGQIATKAVALLERVIDDADAPLKLRVEAAKTILDRAGFVAPTSAEREAGRDGKGAEVLTAAALGVLRARLLAEVGQLQGALVENAQSVALPPPVS